MYLVIFDPNGDVILGPNWRDPISQTTMENIAAGQPQPNYPWLCEEGELPSHRPEELKATIENGAVAEVHELARPLIYLHIAISGGDGLSPVGILNDGSSGANVSISLREGVDPASPLFNIAGNLINITWRVPIVKGSREIWTKVQFVDSVATGVYRTAGEPGLLRLAPERLDPVTLPNGVTYGFKAVGDTEIIVSEELAAV